MYVCEDVDVWTRGGDVIMQGKTLGCRKLWNFSISKRLRMLGNSFLPHSFQFSIFNAVKLNNNVFRSFKNNNNCFVNVCDHNEVK